MGSRTESNQGAEVLAFGANMVRCHKNWKAGSDANRDGISSLMRNEAC